MNHYKDRLRNYMEEQGITPEDDILSPDVMENPDEVMEVEVVHDRN